MMLLAVALIFIAVFLLVTFFSGRLLPPKIKAEKRMEQYILAVTADIAANNSEKAYPGEMAEIEATRPFRKLFAKYRKKIEAQGFNKLIENELQKGDLPLRGYEFLLLAFVLAGGLMLIIFLLNRNMISVIAGGLLGIAGPVIYLRLKQQQKVTKFNNQIGDALVIISNSLKAGYGFMQAIDMVAKEMAPPIRNEFARVTQEINLGGATEEVLINLTERIPSRDLDLVITAMLIQRQIGGNLSEILDNISQTIRERLRIKGEVKALTAQGKLSGLIIGILPIGIGLFLLLVNPQYISQLFTDPRGKFLLAYAVVAELIAVLIIRKIITIKV